MKELEKKLTHSYLLVSEDEIYETLNDLPEEFDGYLVVPYISVTENM